LRRIAFKEGQDGRPSDDSSVLNSDSSVLKQKQAKS
jgi:hypothetical protein